MAAKLTQSRKRKKIGDLVRIPLDGGWFAYGRVLADPDFAFYDLRTRHDTPLDQILNRPVLFRLSVMKHATTTGVWPIIGWAALEERLGEPACYFRQDALTRELFIFTSDGQIWSERPATFEECDGLECLAVWEPEHVQNRLGDHFAGRPNKWLESMRPVRMITTNMEGRPD